MGKLMLTADQVRNVMSAARAAFSDGRAEAWEFAEGFVDWFNRALDGASLEDVVDGLLGMLAEEEAGVDAIGMRLKELRDRKAAFEARVDKIREALTLALEVGGEQKMRRPEATVSLSMREPPLAVQLEKLPAEFVKLTPSADMAKIRVAVAGGEVIEGVVVGEPSRSLTVRRK